MGLNYFRKLYTKNHLLDCIECENFKHSDPKYRNVKTIFDEKLEKLEKEIEILKREIETMKRIHNI